MRDMLGREQALGVDQALSLILDNLPIISPQKTSKGLLETFNAVLAEDVYSPEDLPGFRRSTMDGFAVVAADTFGAGEGNPGYLEVKHEVKMGEEPGFPLKRGEAARIATGGMLPEGADAVLMLEHAQELDAVLIEAQRAVAPGENVVQRGEDVAKGDLLLSKGKRLRPQDVAVLAGVGIGEINVYESPTVSVISTGDEIVPPGAALKPGMVRDINTYTLYGLIRQANCIPVTRGVMSDDYDSIKREVERSASENSVVLISGGSSVGTRDLTERVVAGMGKVLFHSVALKPGKPLLAGTIGGTPVFGLPGHPRAVAVCFDVFIRPVLTRLSGQSESPLEPLKGIIKARMAMNVHSGLGRRENVPVSLEAKEGVLWATPLLGKSGLLSTLVKADGTLDIPAGKVGHEKGEEVEVRLL